MDVGRHDYGRPRTAYDRRVVRGEAAHVFSGRPTRDEALEAAYVAAVRRDNQLTITELSALSPMERTPDGALVPSRLAGRIDGWAGDRSHREGQTKRLIALYARMQEHSDAVTEAIRTGQHPASLISRAVAMRNLWNQIVEDLEQ